MPVIKVPTFDGLIPRESTSALAETNATVATNVKLYSQELGYVRGPLLEYTPPITGVTSIYKYYYTNTAYYWFTWQADVDAQPSPASDTVDYRVYYTGDGVPKKTNLALATSGSGAYPQAWLPMGVYQPTVAPNVSLTGTVTSTTNPQTTAYIYTNLSTFGTLVEESGPSPASSLITYNTGQSPVLTGFTSVPSGYNITKRRIYRVVSGSTSANYQFVADIPVAQTSFTDSVPTTALGAVCPSLLYVEPPSNLSGLITHPCGSLVGFAGNTIYFSEPYLPHAWPVGYQINVPFKIIGLGLWGQSIVVVTDRYPYMLSGYTPGQITSERVQLLEPGVSKRSIQSDQNGVLYASPNGLVSIGYQNRGVITNGIYRRDQWQALVPNNMQGALVDGKYYGTFATSFDGNSIVITQDDTPALSKLAIQPTATHVDSKNANLYYCDSLTNKIYFYDQDELNPLPFTWTSKRWFFPHAQTFATLELDADYIEIANSTGYTSARAAVIAANVTAFASPLLGALNNKVLNYFPVDGSTQATVPPANTGKVIQVLIYADTALVQTLTLTSLDPVRLVPFRCRELQISIQGNVNVRSVALATTTRELAQ